jgi:ubiquinone/menaquinone biosynthesis C-methylase UbiE
VKEYWTQPATYDPVEFDRRFRPELLDVWIPQFIKFGDLAANQRVLDIGCGTGGFAIDIYRRIQAHVIGLDLSERLLRYAVSKSRPLPLRWLMGNAEVLPFADETFDRVLMSLVLHQIHHREKAIREVYRLLRPGGKLLVRTVAPEVAYHEWVPFRFFPNVADIEAARLPAIDAILNMYVQAGFREIYTHTVFRNSRVDLQKVCDELRRRARPSYRTLTEAELENGILSIEREWRAKEGHWIDPKPHLLIIGER